jgi:polyphosphate glucokinase
MRGFVMKVLVIDVGGTHFKILVTGQDTHREFPSGSTLTPERMVAGVQQTATHWNCDVVSIGHP